MKSITIATAILFFTTIACKKEKGQKCYWDILLNNQARYNWLDKPTSDQIKKIQDTCSCTVTVNETCVSCDINVTTQGGLDVPCR
jgi:hypothetical protein